MCSFGDTSPICPTSIYRIYDFHTSLIIHHFRNLAHCCVISLSKSFSKHFFTISDLINSAQRLTQLWLASKTQLNRSYFYLFFREEKTFNFFTFCDAMQFSGNPLVSEYPVIWLVSSWKFLIITATSAYANSSSPHNRGYILRWLQKLWI